MPIPLHKITDRWKFHPLAIVSPTDFTLGESQPIEISDIASDSRFSLYCLDFEEEQACWVRTPENIDITKGSFIYTTQFELAQEMAISSFDELADIVSGIDLKESNITIIHSVGRCGSTLINRVFASQPQIFSLSEPDTITQICEALGAERISTATAARLLPLVSKAVIRPVPGSTRRENVAIKLRSQCISIAEQLCEALPQAHNIYLKRSPENWLRSAYRAFVPPDKVDDREFKQMCEDIFAAFIPIVRAERIENEPMSLAKVWILNWIHNTLCYREASERGLSFLTLDYSEIQSNPRAAIGSIFAHAKVDNIDWDAVDATLVLDSQADSPVARASVKDNAITDHHFKEAMEVLAGYLPDE
ncbi:hypothetical protein [Pelagicoccus sp. SDUM812002]|uniref:hypothetical protein n=1 Tax=Pelagicoccus sp. SDUM812002 TaxID=3041266 RepID=UPI00280CD98D|nr:hypothetical protein [Pelagicoccus sp. SDUM812002]MDQ8184673.1 hypothetical protein [Pelagicoccus sp. SDUM812002]